jgi:hypothetical protein
MAKIIRTSRTGIRRILAQFGQGARAPVNYRWYEVEVACF